MGGDVGGLDVAGSAETGEGVGEAVGGGVVLGGEGFVVLGLNDDEAVGLVVGESGGGLRGDDGAEGTVGGAVAGLEAVAVGGGGDEAGVGVGGIGCSPPVPKRVGWGWSRWRPGYRRFWWFKEGDFGQ